LIASIIVITRKPIARKRIIFRRSGFV